MPPPPTPPPPTLRLPTPRPPTAPAVPTPRLGTGHAFGHGLATLGKSAPVWAKVFAGVAAVSVSATGVAVGADRALPGDFFYGVKKQVEAVQLDLASGAHSKALTELGFAQARINELHKLIQRDHVVAGQPVSKETAAHIKGLLENWAENAGVATTSLIQQIQALGSSQSTAAQSAALRDQLSAFTTKQFGELGTLLGAMPSAALQSLTVSALGYLQRVDAVLGHDPASLIGKLPLSLNSVPGVSKVLPRLVLPSTIPTTGGSAVLPSPSVLTSLVPKAGGLLASLAPGSLANGTGIALPSQRHQDLSPAGRRGAPLPRPAAGQRPRRGLEPRRGPPKRRQRRSEPGSGRRAERGRSDQECRRSSHGPASRSRTDRRRSRDEWGGRRDHQHPRCDHRRGQQLGRAVAAASDLAARPALTAQAARAALDRRGSGRVRKHRHVGHEGRRREHCK